jgi:hypothetical protein
MAAHVCWRLIAVVPATALLAGCRHPPTSLPARAEEATTHVSIEPAADVLLRIKACALGDMDEETVKVAAEALREVLRGRVRIRTALPLPQSAYDAARRQYRSDVILSGIAPEADR